MKGGSSARLGFRAGPLGVPKYPGSGIKPPTAASTQYFYLKVQYKSFNVKIDNLSSGLGMAKHFYNLV